MKAINQKINSLGEVVNQMKWKQKSCDNTALPHKINDSHKISEIIVQLNMCKQEIEHLTSKLSVCSEKDPKVEWGSLESSLNSASNVNYTGNQNFSIASSVSSSHVANLKIDSLKINDSEDSPSVITVVQRSGKRKLPSCTITSMAECPEQKKLCTFEELNDSGIQDEQISTNA